MSKFDFVKEFVEQDMQFKDFDEAQLIFFKSQVTNLGIEVGVLDEKEFNEISDELHRIYEEITKKTNNNNNMEDETMNETAAAKEFEEFITEEESKSLREKAKTTFLKAQEKLEDGISFAIENIDTVADEIKGIANMNQQELGEFIKEKGESFINGIIGKVKEYSDRMKKHAVVFPSFSRNAEKADNLIENIKTVLDTEGLSGWGKIKGVVKEVISWLIGLFMKVGAILLKITFVALVGLVKAGAVGLYTAGKIVAITYNDVAKPLYNAGKGGFNKLKEKAKAKKAEKDFVDEFEEVIFEEDTTE